MQNMHENQHYILFYCYSVVHADLGRYRELFSLGLTGCQCSIVNFSLFSRAVVNSHCSLNGNIFLASLMKSHKVSEFPVF